MINILTIISFLLDGILSRYININSIFLPLFTIVSLIIIYPYFNDNNSRYFKYISIIGLLYDIVYCNTIFFNSFIFLILGFFIIMISYSLSNNIYVNILITMICISLYRIINYLFVVLFKNVDFTFIVLFKSIYSSLILNIIYCIILYLSSEYFSNKYKIQRSK